MLSLCYLQSRVDMISWGARDLCMAILNIVLYKKFDAQDIRGQQMSESSVELLKDILDIIKVNPEF